MASTTETLPELVGGDVAAPLSFCDKAHHKAQMELVGGGYLLCKDCGQQIPNSILNEDV